MPDLFAGLQVAGAPADVTVALSNAFGPNVLAKPGYYDAAIAALGQLFLVLWLKTTALYRPGLFAALADYYMPAPRGSQGYSTCTQGKNWSSDSRL